MALQDKETKKKTKRTPFEFKYSDLNSASLSDEQVFEFWSATAIERGIVTQVTEEMKLAASIFVGTVLFSEKFKPLLQK